MAVEVADQQARPPVRGVTVGELADRYMRFTAAQERSPVTLTGYRARRRWLAPIEPSPAVDVTAADLDGIYMGMLEAGQAAVTVMSVHRFASAVFNQALRWGLVTSSPADGASPPRPRPRPVDVPDPATVTAALTQLETLHPPLGLLARIGYVSGARRGSLCALRWTDLDGDVLTVSRAIRVTPQGLVEGPTKNRTVATVHLDQVTVETLSRWRTRSRAAALAYGLPLPDDAYLVSAEPDGTVPLHPNTLSQWWSRHRHRIGLPDMRLHDLRHAMASHLMAAGVDPTTIAQRGGWQSTTQLFATYSHPQAEADRAAGQLIGNMLSG